MFDTHTHTPRPDAAVCIDPVDLPDSFEPAEGVSYSVGIHPWNAARVTPRDISLLRHLAAHPRVVAIGETGLDANAEAPREVQADLLRLHIALSEETSKPLVLHMVRGWDTLLALRSELRPRQAWVVHGFRGKPELARQLLAAGLFLSYGERFNPASVAVTPADRLLVETDESTLPLAEIVARLGVTPVVTLPDLSRRGIAPQARELGALDGRPLEQG